MPIVINDSLTRASEEFDLGSFYEAMEGVDYSKVTISDLTDVPASMEALMSSIDDLLNNFDLQGDLQGLVDQLVQVISRELNINLGLKALSDLTNAFSILCNGFKFNLPNLSSVLQEISLSFLLTVTICNRDNSFGMMYDGHLHTEINGVSGDILRLRDEIGIATTSSHFVTQAQQELNEAEDALGLAETTDGTVQEARDNLNDTEAEIKRLEEELELIRLGIKDGDYDLIYDQLVIARTRRLEYIALLEQVYVNSIDVNIALLYSEIVNKRKLLDNAIGRANSSKEVLKLTEELSKQEELYRKLKNDKDTLFARVAVKSLKMSTDKADSKSISKLIDDIVSTDVKYTLRKMDVSKAFGDCLDSCIEDTNVLKVESKDILLSDKSIIKNKRVQPSYVTNISKESKVKLNYEKMANNPNSVMPLGNEYNDFNYSTLVKLMNEILIPNELTLDMIRESKVLRTTMIRMATESDDVSLLRNCI